MLDEDSLAPKQHQKRHRSSDPSAPQEQPDNLPPKKKIFNQNSQRKTKQTHRHPPKNAWLKKTNWSHPQASSEKKKKKKSSESGHIDGRSLWDSEAPLEMAPPAQSTTL